MIRLDTTNRSLQLLLGSAQTTAPMQIVVSYSDQTTTSYLGATQLSNSNGTSAVTICSAPAASTIRDIDMVSVINSDTTDKTVTINLLDSSIEYKILTATLTVGDKLTYTHGSGWQVTTNTGQLKLSGNAGTIAIGTVTTGAAGSSASISNSGSTTAAILNFTIPQGVQGPAGANGAQGLAGANGQGVPTGGIAGQVLTKLNDTDYATTWAAGGGGGSVDGGLYNSTFQGIAAVDGGGVT
jgi:hypothetical protein